MRAWLQSLREPQSKHREPAQIIVLFAVFIIVLMVLAGSAYDYASIVVDDARLQNAVDAAALAGSNALSANANKTGGTPVAIASATTGAYLQANGVSGNATVTMAFPTSTPPAIAGSYENIQLQVNQNHPTAFWPLVGINSVKLSDGGNAHAARNMVDVMLVLDTTGSEVISGSLTAIQQAVGAFVSNMAPNTADSRGPKIGVSRFAGIQCQYDTAHGHPSNYDQGCVNDWYVLNSLTNDSSVLNAIANGGAACPAGDAARGGCPIQHVYYNASNRATTTSQSTAYSSGYDPGFTGTKLPNAFYSIGLTGGASGPYAFGSSYSWSTANGGRNDSTPNSAVNARKVMVIMTDGQNEMYPTPGPGGNEQVSTYNTQMQTMADTLQKGPDGITGTYDDVEIYVVGYFCTDYPNGFCQSSLADTWTAGGVHPCPAATFPTASASDIDTRLNNLASSTPGSCDHYYPLGKDDSQQLSGLFTALAGRISRGQLTQ
jgi:Flp pilus assembly protein TadG